MHNIRLVLYQQSNGPDGLHFYLSLIHWMSSLS